MSPIAAISANASITWYIQVRTDRKLQSPNQMCDDAKDFTAVRQSTREMLRMISRGAIGRSGAPSVHITEPTSRTLRRYHQKEMSAPKVIARAPEIMTRQRRLLVRAEQRITNTRAGIAARPYAFETSNNPKLIPDNARYLLPRSTA